MTALLPILHEIDLRVGLDLALALRRIGRERRQERSRKGWRTRRDRDAIHEDAERLSPEGGSAGRRHRPMTRRKARQTALAMFGREG